MIKTKQWITKVPANIETVWDFFSRPENLNKLTPNDMNFEFLTDTNGKEMYEGMLINYKVSPMLGLKLSWLTEITKIEPQKYFIDEQRVGPYKIWHHEHHFKEINENMTEMTDILTYKVGKGIVGTIADALFVENKIQQIFDYRAEAIKKIF